MATTTPTIALRTRWTATLRPVLDRTLVRHLVLAVVGLVVVLLVLETGEAFRASQLTVVAYTGIAAAGLTVLTGLSGQISLGHGAFMAIGGYTAAVLHGAAAPPLFVTLLVATVVALVVGVGVGFAAARLHGPYLAGATLALAVAVPGLAVYFPALGGEQGLHVRAPQAPVWLADAAFFLTAHDLSSAKYLAYVAWGALVVTFVLLANLSHSRVGRTWRSVRDDPVAAQLAGTDVGRARVSAFVVGSACAGLAGALLVFAVGLAAPSGFSVVLSLTLLSAVVLGGLGSLPGALLGAAVLTFLPQMTTSVGRDLGLDDLQAAELAPLVHGVVLIVVVLVAPTGLAGLARAFRRDRRPRASRSVPATR